MKKIIATTAAALLLSLGAFAAPAGADSSTAPTCEQSLAEAQYRETLLHFNIEGLQDATRVMNHDLVRAERKIKQQRATIQRLRAQLASR